MKLPITKIIRIIAVAFSCCSCAGMIFFSSQGNNDAVYACIIACVIGFFANMVITAHENAKILEAQKKELEAQQTQE